MKIIAHRGGKIGKENSLETLTIAARMDTYAVECDIRRTKDGVYVIYHDDNLSRLAGYDATVSGVTYSEMCSLMAKNGREVLTFEELKKGYKEETPILLHIKLKDYDNEFAKYIAESGLPIIAGVVSLDMLKSFSQHLPSERILAFMPDYKMAEDFYKAGAGILRLWEHWLDDIKPKDVKKQCPNAQVFIMASNLQGKFHEGIPLEWMDGSYESLDKCYSLGADGVLLNDIEMAFKWKSDKGLK